MKIIGYSIKLMPDEYRGWHQTLVLGRSLPREIAGFILGRAEPYFGNDLKEETKNDPTGSEK